MSYVYKLLQGDDVVYVGKSIDVEKRVREHAGYRNFDSAYYYLNEDESLITNIENYLIATLKPLMNTVGKTAQPQEGVEIPDDSEWIPIDMDYVDVKMPKPIGNGVTPPLVLANLHKCPNGVTISIEMLVLWSLLYKEKLAGRLKYVTISDIGSTLNMDRHITLRLFYKLVSSGIVDASLEVKNKGVKKENKGKAPKKWRIYDVKHPDEV